MTSTKRRLMVTSALPYANGSLHLGHMVEYIQTDIFVRFQRLRGAEVYYLGADDAHGTPIMLRAEKEGLSPEELINKMQQEHKGDFDSFLISFDKFHSTHSAENREISYEIYGRLKERGYTTRRVIQQFYDPKKEIFLPDRFIKGECPKCHSQDQYGDNCEVCSATYAPEELINPYSILSNERPILRESEHIFFDLPQFSAFLQEWLDKTPLQSAMRNKMAEWADSLTPWDISRDGPYWGFPIPGEDNKYFYVWLDAPIGYFASLKAFAADKGLNYREFLEEGHGTELYHFIGKDIAYFHLLFWPAMLEGAGFRKPSGVFCHGFLTVDGQKMSKSRGTFIKARTYLNHLRPEYLRYYFANKLSARVEDIDLNLQDFKTRINSDLVGKYINLASRSFPFITKNFNGQLAEELTDNSLQQLILSKKEIIAAHYEQREYNLAMREIMALVDRANEYIDAAKPWVKIKEENNDVQQVCTVLINAFYALTIYLKPVLPEIAAAVEALLNIGASGWEDLDKLLLNQAINPYKPLLQRIEDKALTAIIEETKRDLAAESNLGKAPAGTPADYHWIKIEDFAALDIRIAKVISCQTVEGSDKLLQFQLDVGELGARQVFSGIKQFHQPEELVGQLVVYLANLTPRKMRFGLSEGMILSASNSETLQVLLAGGRAAPGMKIS